MRATVPIAVLPSTTLLAALLAVLPVAAQEHTGEHHDKIMEHHPAVVPDLLEAVGTVREKLVGLAEAIPEESWGWRPGEGVRSVREVVMHVAADNYLLPTATGVEAPASTGIRGDSYPSVQAFEGREVTKAEALAHLQSSFDHLAAAMEAPPRESMGEDVTIFGMELTGQALWIMTTTHLHEHLGQVIAYARINGVVPPWSR